MTQITQPDFRRLCVVLRRERKCRLKFGSIPASSVRTGMMGTLYEIKRIDMKWTVTEELGEYQILDGRPSFWPKDISYTR
jgi:hypothetical protein